MGHEGLKVSPSLLFFLMPLNNLAHQFGQANGGIITTGKHKCIEQILCTKQIASEQFSRSAWSLRYSVWNSIIASLQINLIFFSNQDRQIASHYLAQRGYLNLFLLIMSEDRLIQIHIINIYNFSTNYLAHILDLQTYLLLYSLFYFCPFLLTVHFVCQKAFLKFPLSAGFFLKLSQRFDLVEFGWGIRLGIFDGLWSLL